MPLAAVRLHGPKILAILAGAVLLGAGGSKLEALLNAPLESADPARPIEVIASHWWVVTEGISAELEDRIPPEQRMTRGMSVPLGSFVVDGSKGPVTLVVDYGAIVNALTGADGSVRVGIECVNQPLQCAVPANKTVLMFHADLMAKRMVELKDDTAQFAIGRESHSYRFPPDETVRVDLELGTPHRLDPLLIKAWLIYGENEADVVPGQRSKANAIRWVIGGGIVVLILLVRRLTRR